MFNKNKCARIWKAVNIHTGIVKDGKTFNYSFREETVPPFEKIAETTINNLKEQGFLVKRVAPKRANCIIRVFRHEKLTHEEDTFWMYGADIFLKKIVGMYPPYETTGISYDECKIKMWFCQDDYAIFEPHFVDYFVKII